ncbi:MAG: gamma-glutamyl-gamma-aminobutyrate hydrolase family protein [Armatimonadota bacterium]|nr:gamma-glutamyl-gamma-aminobutyrate hydrolase family protein [Armatimonadota bacterium]MDR7452599.1 gamma-glutamyl-gamma-aminobutyrate hydrolase family protein [Armatimonadota bacterium]MDR7468240.1 gamma-glutamyl-gamma-aminobutyrate hydrolase family protein [Armatimonadota bacterium]MDR7495234.1 gamma-glutamyl-gamma-aminobutyrate hydrolase family protein [Armatimonadota bacterium]MDR7500481.1 gamma-glutamyl-gamma-aminobutyrate hydrolase family protein [Armatimonadota bacterium]
MDAPRVRVGITAADGGSATPQGRAYAAAVEAAGGEVVWLEPSTVSGRPPEEILREVDALLLSGGVDVDPRHFGEDPRPEAGVEVDPARDAVELPLIRAALEQDVPVLGICRGVQLLNVAAGGTLHQDLGLVGFEETRHQQRAAGRRPEELAHEVRIERGSRLGRILGADRVEVNSFHHQGIKTPAPGFAVTARSADGVIEGLEHPGRTFVVGVQWHPERMVAAHPVQRRLFSALLEAARRRRQAAGRPAT